jgi:hypothetical protein
MTHLSASRFVIAPSINIETSRTTATTITDHITTFCLLPPAFCPLPHSTRTIDNAHDMNFLKSIP